MFRSLRGRRRPLALFMGLFLLQAFLAPGDLACALRHHAKQVTAGDAAPVPQVADHSAHDAEAMAGHDMGAMDHGTTEPSPTPADHCADPARGHCAWMSACAPVAVMMASDVAPAAAAHALDVVVAAHVPILAGISLAPDVPPPRG